MTTPSQARINRGIEIAEAAACRVCAGVKWVCENHRDRPWGGLPSGSDACECGAGAPCGACNLELASAGYVDVAVQRTRADAIEECARVADAHLRGHKLSEADARRRSARKEARDYESMALAAYWIDTAIRALAKPPCPRCDNAGSPDYAGFALERCGCVEIAEGGV